MSCQDANHEVEARDARVLIAFVEPESNLGAALAGRLKNEITPISTREVRRWRASLGNIADLTASYVEQWLRKELLQGGKVPRIHPRVRRVLRFLREQLGTPKAVSLQNLATIAGLSRSRFMHAFTESVGVPVRPDLTYCGSGYSAPPGNSWAAQPLPRLLIPPDSPMLRI